MKSIKTRLILSFSTLILILTLIIGIVSLGISYFSIKKEAETSLKLLAEEGAKLTESRMETLIKTLELISKKDEIKNMGWEVNLPILKEELNKTDFLDLGYVLPNGYVQYTDGTVRLERDREYVMRALKGEASLSDVVISRVSRKPEIMVAVPVIVDGKVFGALVGRKQADALSNIIRDSGYGKKGFSYMINEKGTIIAHPDEAKVLNYFNPLEEQKNNGKVSDLAEAFTSMIEVKNGVFVYSYEGKTLYAGFSSIPGTDWIFVINADQKEVLAILPKMIRSISAVMIVVILIGIGTAIVLDSIITKPLLSIIRNANRISDLDVSDTIYFEFTDRKDEIGNLSRAFQTLTQHLRDILTSIKSSSLLVTNTAGQLSSASGQSVQIIDEISNTVQEIARSSSDQALNTEAGFEHATELGNLIERNQEHLQHLNKATDQVSIVVHQGLKEIDKLNQATKENNEATREICEMVSKTRSSSSKIGEASKFIAELAEQINLLSLNAAIEAARSGEAGKGFTVVAEQIKIMADQSAKSTKYISGIVKELQENVSEAVNSIERISVTSDQQQKSVMETSKKFEDISAAMKNSSTTVSELYHSGQNMTNAKTEILDKLDSLSSIATQNAAATEEVSSVLEEQTASMEEIASVSEQLSKLAADLQTVIMKFHA